jgi:hypothetical protein
LTDVSFYDGGRQVTVTSSFEILNKTSHKIQLASHTDSTHISRGKRKKFANRNHSLDSDQMDRSSDSRLNSCNLQVINPGEIVQVPILLLEASLQEKGNNLGSFWLRPFEREQTDFIRCLDIPSLKAADASIGFCSSPIQLIQLVKDSAIMFKESGGNIVGSESFSSGYQLSCPIVEKNEESISPFCYCVEVRRSPLVSSFPGHDISSAYDKPEGNEEQDLPGDDMTENLSNNLQDQRNDLSSNKSNPSNRLLNEVDAKKRSNLYHPCNEIHGPVAYSLEIHPPIVIENLLPQKARYELMHAARKKVVWWSNLMPGESVPVYTVGLDAPLLLLIHLGYCRTPVGEGVSFSALHK